MARSLDEVKKCVAERYLGKGGIHAVGLDHSENAIHIYVEGKPDENRKRLLRQLEVDGAPYKIITIESDRASIK